MIDTLRETITNIVDSEKPIYLGFSGGYDSTFLLNLLIKELNNSDRNDKIINLVVFNFSESGILMSSSQEYDELARRDIILYFKSKYPCVELRTIEITVSISKDDYNVDDICEGDQDCLPLQVNQLSYLLSVIPYNSIFIIGWIRGDRAISDLEEFNTLVHSYSKLLGKELEFYVPLFRTNKTFIISSLLMDDPELFFKCNTCDSQDVESHIRGNDCNCNSCASVKSSLFNLALYNYHNYGLVDNIYAKTLKVLYGISITKEMNHES